MNLNIKRSQDPVAYHFTQKRKLLNKKLKNTGGSRHMYQVKLNRNNITNEKRYQSGLRNFKALQEFNEGILEKRKNASTMRIRKRKGYDIDKGIYR